MDIREISLKTLWRDFSIACDKIDINRANNGNLRRAREAQEATKRNAPPSTGIASAVAKSTAMAIVAGPVGLIAAPFWLFKPLVRVATNTVAEQIAKKK